MTVSIIELYFYIILFFPISTLFQNYFDAINRILFVFLFALLIVLLTKRIKKKSLYMLLVMIANYLYALLMTAGRPDNLNDLFYFPFVIIFLLYMSDNAKAFEKIIKEHEGAIRFALRAWSILVIISFFLPSSYTTGWGGAKYFGSYCKTVFRLAPACILIMTLALCAMNFYGNRQYVFYTLVPMISIYMGGSRTYLLVGMVLFIVIWYYYVSSKKVFLFSVVPLTGVLILSISISAMADKISATRSSSSVLANILAAASNGRTIFWWAEIKAYFASGVLAKLFGHGYNYVYDVNQQAVQTRIWAHNDFLQILLSNGLIGLGLYLFSIREMLKSLKLERIKGIKKLVPLAGCFLVWFINAMFNMFFSYFCCVLALPFLVYAIQKKSGLQCSFETKR